MKLSLPVSLLCLCSHLYLPATLSAAETAKFEAVLYLFRGNAISHIDFSSALKGLPARSGGGIVITPPATVLFDKEQLHMQGASYTWNDGRGVPAQFSETKLPAMVAPMGEAVTVRMAVPVQFLERTPDGTLKLREMAGDLPDTPHYVLTLGARPAADGPPGYDMIVSCRMDIATMQGREKIAGIDLDVGRPITARFDRHIEYWGRENEWFGLMSAQEESGDYGLFLLLKVITQPGADASSAAPMTEDELDRFVSAYSSHPQPELMERAIEGVGVAGGKFLGAREYELVGFFAEIFAANPERITAWRKVIERQSGPVLSLFRRALRLGKPGAVLGTQESSVQNNSIYWGAFYATRNPAYLRKLVDQLALIDNAREERFNVGSMAMELLSWQASNNPLVRPILEECRVGATPRTQELITDLLQKPPAIIHKDLDLLYRSRVFHPYSADPQNRPPKY